MRCPKCSADKRDTARFCDGCGAPIEPHCPSCGALSRVGARFCDACGAALRPVTAATTASSSSAAAEVPSIRVAAEREASASNDSERKTVTALFADIKGSMELMRNLDPEEARAIVDPVLRLMMAAVHRYEGYVAQSTGDGIFALFGAPVAHEDHPQRALHAALAMQEELHRYADRLRAEARFRLKPAWG
jgi:class 3 adenylate cyclase